MAFDQSSIKLDGFDPDNVIDGAAPAKAEQGDYLRGLKKYVPQMQEMYGAGKALVGKAIDSEGMVQSGIETMQDANRKVEEIGSKPTDEFTNVKSVGDFADWAQHGLGQVTGNLAESLVAAGAGTLLGGALGNPITAGVGGATGFVGKKIIKDALLDEAKKIAVDQGEGAAKKFVAKEIGKDVGQNAAIAGMAGFHGAGETGSRAFQEANYDPNQVELGQVLPRAAGHAAAEFLGDKILLGGMLGKGTYRAAGEGAYPLVKTVAGNMAIVAGKEIPVELVQTVLERDAAKLELMSPEARDEYINTAAQTMLFGIAGAPAGVRSYMAKPPQQTKPMTQEEAAADLTASNTELAGATAAYDALPSDVPQIGYNGKPDAIIVPNQSGGTTEINRNDGALSAAVVDTGITGQMLDNGTTLVPFSSRDAAQSAIDQREDADRLTVVPHPRVSGRFAMVPKDRLTLEAQDQAAMRRQQLEEEDGNAPQLDEAGNQGRGSVAGGGGGNASAVSGIGGGRSNASASSIPGRGTSMAMGTADATESALALESSQNELAPQSAQPVSSMPGVQARNAERIAAARIAAEARGTALVDEEAAAANTSPSEAQIAAGNYKKGHIKVGPLDISVENPIGSTRSGKEGKKSWTTTMRAHYGYIKRTVGADGDQVDVFVKEGTPADHSGTVYVIDQFNPKTGRFDEHKGMIGYSSQADAALAYDDHFGDKSGPKRRKAVIGMPASTFARWAKEGDTTSPISQSGRTADESQAEIEKSTGKLSPSRQKAAGRDPYAVAQEANDRRSERTTGMPEQAHDNAAVARTIGATDFEEVKDEALPDAKDTDAPGVLSRQAASSLRMLAKLFGKKVVIFKTDADADGFYINGNTIYIKSDSSVSQLRVLGHEMMHALRRQAPKVYQQTLDAVSELITDAELKAFYADYNNGKTMPAEMSAEQRDALVEEWMADLGGNRWGEAEFWSSMFAKLEEQHGTTPAKKIINQLRMAVVKVINSLLRTIRGGTMFAVDRRMADNLEKIREAMAQGFADYAKAVKDGRTVEPAGEGGVKFAKKAAEDRKNRTLDEVRSRIGNDYDLTVADNPRVMIDGKPFTTTNVDVDAHGPGLLVKDADATMRRMMDEAIAESGLPSNLAKDLRPPTAAYTDKALKLTNGSRFWYELSATGFAGRFFKLPVLMAERLIDIVAGTSGGQQPTDNLKISVAAMAQDMQDLPVTTGVRDPSSLTGALSPEALTTHKFGNFSDTMQLLANLRPGVEPLPTVDLQMAAVFGIRHAEVASNPVMYETISRFLIKLRDAQNAMQPGAQPYESWQMQALLWVAERNTSDPDSYDIGMPKIVKMLQDAGIPTPGGAITEKTLMDPRVPEVMSPTTKSVPEAPVMTIETRTQLTKTGRSSTEAFNKIKEIDAPWAKKLTREFESIQRRTMRALGNRQPHPKGLSTKQPSVVSQLMAIIMGRTIASWDAVRVDTNGMGTFEGDASPNLRVPMLLAQRGGSDGKGGTPRFMLDANQRKQLASLIGKDMKQAAMADSQFVSVPLGKHDTFSIFVKRYDKEDISESLLAEISDSLGRPLNYSQVPNGWLIDVNIGGFDETAQQQAENRDVQRIRAAMQKVEKSSGTKYDWHELPRAYASDYIDKSDYNKHIKELENAITRNTDPGRSRGTGDPQQRLGDLARLRAQVQGLYKQQESAFKQWEQEARDTAAKRGVKFSPARGYERPAANGGVAGQGRPGDRQLGRVDVTGTHYSREQRKHLTGGYFGTGLAGEEGKRLKEAKDTRLHSRLYAYVNEGQGVFPEAGVGAYAHTVKLDNLYDIKADPLGVRQKTRDANDRESLILDAGFDGYYAPGVFGRQGVAILMGGAATRGVTPTDTVAPAVNAETAPKTERRTDLPLGKMTGSEWKKLEPRATDLEDGKMYYRDEIKYSPPRWYFSPLEKAFESAPDKVFGQAAQVKLWLAGNKSKLGLKDDEIFWTGINDWLDMQGKQKVSKADVLGYLAGNGVQVEEVMKGSLGYNEDNPQLPENYFVADVDEYIAEENPQTNGFSKAVMDESGVVYGVGNNEADAISDAHSGHPELWEKEGETKYGKYVLPGGTNYRELLLTLPVAQKPDITASQEEKDAWRTKADKEYRSGHWEEPNILAHIRMNDRTDADGNKVLFIEEVQSDWGQAGKKQGFRVAPNKKRVSEIMSRMDEIERSIGAQAATKDAEYDALEKELGSVSGRNETGPYPSPFVTDTKAWLGLSIKRIMAYAAANGYDKVAFIDGQQSTDRYWKHELIAPAVDRWNEITKPESVRELGDNIFGREMYSLMSLNHMDAGVLPMVKHDQVRKSIVSRIPVDVVDVLSSNGVKAEELFSNGDVVFDRLPVSYRSRAATAFGAAIGQTSASIRAKLSGIESGGSDFEVLPALRASDLGPRELVGILDPQRLFHGGSGLGSEKTTPASAVAKSALLEKGDGLKGQFGSAELAKLLNAHVELRYGREGLLKHSVEPGPGQGMKAFYDRIVPQVVSDQLKKVGGKMETVRVGTGSVDKTSDRLGSDTSEIQITRDAAGNWGVEKNPDFVVGGKRLYWNGNTFVEDEGAARVFGSKEEATASVTASSQTGFTVTPKMSEPLPLFSPKRSGPDVFDKAERELLKKHKAGQLQQNEWTAGMTDATDRFINEVADRFGDREMALNIFSQMGIVPGNEYSFVNLRQHKLDWKTAIEAGPEVQNFKVMLDSFASSVSMDDAVKYIKGQPYPPQTVQIAKDFLVAVAETMRYAVNKKVVSNPNPSGLLASLSPRRQTETPEFKAWFKDSKVVEANGKPLVVYHGTRRDFDVFQLGKDGGIHVGTVEQANSRPAKLSGLNLMPLYAAISNPKRVKDMGSDTKGWRLAIRQAKEEGHDGLIYTNRYEASALEQDSYVAFYPGQVKSAIGNNGDFDPENPDIRKSTTRIIGASTRPYSQDHTDFFRRVGRTIDEPSFLEKLGAMRSDFGKKMATGIVDQFRGLKDLGPGGMQAYMLSRLSKGASGAFDALLHHGKLRLRDNVYDADTSGGFVDRLGIPLNGELEDFMWWVAANRADTLAAQGKENLFSPQDISAGKSLATGQTTFDYTLPGGATTRNRALIYKDALRIFNEFNKNILDVTEQSGLIDGASRPYWENQFYVPFYRVSEEDNEFIGSNIKSGLVRQRAFQKLKGGTDKLNSDLLSNTLLNWSHLIDASAKNRAAKASLQAAEQAGVAQKVAPDMASYAQSNGALLPPGTKKTVWYMDNGQKQEYKVTDPFVMTAITGLEYAGMRNPIMDTLSKFKHWLTVGVTASPAFKVRNLIRDSLQAIGASELGYNPVTNVVKGFKASNRASQDYVSALAGGGLIRFGTMLEGSESSRVRQLIKSGVKDSTILNSDGKLQQFYDRTLEPLVSAYNEIGNRGEEINRMALYKQLVAQGRSHAEASLLARDLMDFSMQGSFNTIRFLTQIVPFMNARLQGMYKLGRAAKDDPRKLAIVTGATALFSIALMMASEDDDDWKKREDWDRDNFWWFKIGDTAWRIPKPFEVGAVATLAERSVELMLNDEMNGERYRKILKSLLLNNLSMNPVPQAIKPIVDLYANKDSFTGRPIENMSMQRLDPTERYTASTSLPARAVSASIGGALSPVQVDHIVRGYFSWLGTFVVGGADMLSRAASNEPTRPTMDYLKFATQGIGQEVGSGGSRYITQMYDQANELEQAHATWNHLKREGRIEEAREYMAEHADELKRYKPLAKVKEMESKLNERIRAIERSNIDPDQKKTQIDNVKKMKDQVARRVAPGVD